VETYEIGIVEKISTWKSGKGYFVKFAESDEDFYAFGKCPVKEGDQVKYDYAEGTGAFADRYALTHLSLFKKEDAKVEAPKKEAVKAAPKEATLSGVPLEYRHRQCDLMQECFEDAANLCTDDHVVRMHIALAFFDKRNTHLFWYLQEKGMAKP